MDNKERLRTFNTWYSEDRDKYRQFAEAARIRGRFTQEMVSDLYDRGRAYIIECREADKPLTVAGLQIACDCNKMAFSRMKRGEFDWRLFQFMEYKGIREDDIECFRDDELQYSVNYWTDEDGVMYIMEMYSSIIERFYLDIQNQIETACYDNKGNPSGLIFALKSAFGWHDKPEDQKTGVAVGHIATREEAAAAIKRITEGSD